MRGPVPLSAGAAKVEITPPVGTPLAGYSKRRGKPSAGIRDPLFVRVLTLSDGEDRLVLVSADLLLFPPPLAEAIQKELEREFKIPARAVVLAGTHTHSGTGGIAPGFLYEMVFGPYRPALEEGVKARVIWAVRQAIEHERPARWGMKRTGRLLEGLIENRRNPSEPADPSLAVLWVETPEGRPLALLANAAAHPTLMDGGEMSFSADYPGRLCRAVEILYPGAVALFMNGAAGDVRPLDAIGATPAERIDRFGDALAEGVTGLVSQMGIRTAGDLACWEWEIPLPPPQLHLGPLPVPPAIGRRIRPGSSGLSLLAIDEWLLVPLAAEMTTLLGQELKRRLAARGLEPVLLGYADGYLGYAVAPSQWQQRSYEARMTWYGPAFGLYLVQRIQELSEMYRREEKR